MQGEKGLRQRELCDKLGLDYRSVAANAKSQKISTHDYIQRETGWILVNELYYPPNRNKYRDIRKSYQNQV
ncbi:MAG: hypothetical protein KME60_11925 [Cyanomargarita calcarea GSE-NOS-MK-12-04C]|jgi:hypothetical protein|uniref:Uncharacterized protein n=1 Tax=Cyanomargarita calcarea GSE-NOS-MK-12-04C TaxID=2839659 RepID=A0A951UUP5_9CYAN|nr:hypothetical protein [Cyanomargarita calcarea GSE-NOS-MK-12-04C]